MGRSRNNSSTCKSSIPNPVDYDTAYISGACNSNPYAADWGENNVVCLAIEEAVALIKFNSEIGAPGRIDQTFVAHSSRVNAVKWIRSLNEGEENGFISAAVDGNAIVWLPNKGGLLNRKCVSGDYEDYIPKYFPRGHTESITDINAVSLKWQDTNYIFAATLSMDTLKLWKKSEHDDEFSCFYTVNNPETGIGVSGLSFTLLPDAPSLIIASCRKFVSVSLYTYPLKALNDDSLPGCKEAAILSGHTNWVNDLAFTTSEKGKTVLLASASHDCTIRIWRITEREEVRNELSLREMTITTEEKEFSITLCSILHGHDQWIYTVQWKHFDKEEKEENRLKLLSVSADKTAIVWQRDLALNTWTESYRLGDVGGNVAGFLGGGFDPTGHFVMTHDLIGAFHIWRYNKPTDTWSSAVLPGGHNDTVNDIQWDPKGQFLISVGADKTTRLHAPWERDPSKYWYEFARPQTHGHSIACVAILPEFRFVSGAYEKELRAFSATRNFVLNFKKASSSKEEIDVNKYPHNNAILPSLDLSNKPADEMENMSINSTNGSEVDSSEQDRTFPTEEELASHTLWPEIQKLYYHPNEISCVAATSDGELLASACKASASKEAAIAIWSVKWDSFERIQELWFHQLTVTQLAFSPDGLYLLSVSRDRTWHLFKKTEREDNFESIAFATKTNAIHKRQLHTCAWSHDSKFFATGSRDGKMVIWSHRLEGSGDTSSNDSLNGYHSRYILNANDENMCAVAFAPEFVKAGLYLIAIGFGSGKIQLYAWNGVDLRSWFVLEKNAWHHKEVTRLAFRPVFVSQEHHRENSILQLASAGADRMVRIYNLYIDTLS